MEKHIETQVKKRVKGEARKRVQSRRAEICKETGCEILDETPLFVEVGQKPELTMDQKIRKITAQVQAETAARLAAQNMTEDAVQRILDEESDFSIPDEFEENLTVYEAQGVVSDLEEEVIIQTEPTSSIAPAVPQEPDVSGREEPRPSSSPAEQSDIEDYIADGGEATA
jgi:hypothetical protein